MIRDTMVLHPHVAPVMCSNLHQMMQVLPADIWRNAGSECQSEL